MRALCKFLFKLDEKQIPKLEIPTGNPLHIELDQKLKIINADILIKIELKIYWFFNILL